VSFFSLFKHLLPRGEAWKITIDKTLRRFFLGLSEQPQETRDYVDKVYLDLFPGTARSSTDTGIAPEERSGALEEWERQFGLTPPDLTDFTSRRAAVDAEWKAIGGQSPGYIQGILQAAGFDVYVHEWWSSGPPYVARDPRLYTALPLIGLYQCTGDAFIGPDQPACSALASQPQCTDFLINDVHYLVNKDLTHRAPPRVPDDPTKWPYFIYVGGVTFPDEAIVDVARRDEFERLLLKLRPTHNWIVTLISYTDGTESLWLTEGGDFIVTEGGDFFEIE
jgi:hypothetical protein